MSQILVLSNTLTLLVIFALESLAKDLGHHLGSKMLPLGLLLAILGTILGKNRHLGVLLAILGTILAQNGPLGGPLGDLGHNLGRSSLYSQTPDQPQSGRYLYIECCTLFIIVFI